MCEVSSLQHTALQACQRTKAHNQIKLIRILERELQRHDERIIHQGEDGAFRQDVRDFTGPRRDVRLSDGLEGVNPLSVLFLHLHDFSERAFADDFEKLELLDG